MVFLWSYHKYGSPVIANQSDDVIVFSNGISNALKQQIIEKHIDKYR